MGQIQSIEELLDFLRRRWLIVALVALVGTVIAVFYALSRPVTFEAIAAIRVEAPVVQAGGATPAGRPSSVEVLQGIEQRLTSRENMTAVIERHGLFTDTPGLSRDQQIGALRGMIRFQAIESVAEQSFGQPRGLAAILVYATAGDAEIAARLANDFAQGILDQSASGQLQKANESVAFFEEDEAGLWAEMAALEQKIADYKNAHADALPDLVETRRSEISGLDNDIRAAEQERSGLLAQIDQLEAKENPRETDRRHLADLRAQLEVLVGQIERSTTRRAEVEASLADVPEVERVLTGLSRELDKVKDAHEQVTQRLTEARTAQRLAERGQDERFTLLERALRPEFPKGGGRKKLAIAGAVGSVLAGLGLAFLFELMRPVVRNSGQMQRQTGLRPVVVIPDISARSRRNYLAEMLRLAEEQLRKAAHLSRPAVIAGAGLTLAGIALALVV